MLGELELQKCSHMRLPTIPVDIPAMAKQPNHVANITNANHEQS